MYISDKAAVELGSAFAVAIHGCSSPSERAGVLQAFYSIGDTLNNRPDGLSKYSKAWDAFRAALDILEPRRA